MELCDDTTISYGELSLDLWNESLQVLGETTKLKSALGLECSCMLLERLVIEQATPRSTAVDALPELTTETLNLVVRNWSHCWHNRPESDRPTRVTPPQMLSLIDDWLYRLDNALHPDVHTYAALIQGAIKKHSDPIAARSFAENLFRRMLREAQESIHPNVRPDNRIYSSIIHFLAQLGEIQRAETYLNEMYMEFARGNSAVQPNVKNFISILTGYSHLVGSDKDPHNEIPARAESILRHMQHLHALGTLPDVKPNAAVYCLVLRCLCKSKVPKSAVEPALKLYNEMKSSRDVRPSSLALSLVLHTLSMAGDGRATQALLDEHLRDPDSDGHLPKPGRPCFKSAFLAWERSGDADALENVERLLQTMKELPSPIQPDTLAYNIVLSRLVEHSGPVPSMEDRVRRADEIIKEMEDLTDAGQEDAKPNLLSYNRLIHLHAMDCQDPFRAEEVLERMYRFHLAHGSAKSDPPDRSSFNICMKAWADYGGENAPKRAEGILRRMWKLHESGVLPDVRPDSISYMTVLKCLSNSRQPDAGERCQQLLDEMIEMGIQPDKICYALSVIAWARANCPERAATLLSRWIEQNKDGSIDGRPDVRAFQSILGAWSRSGKPNAGEKAQELINQMHHYYKSGWIVEPPDRRSYLYLIEAWTNSKHPWACEHAEAALHQMELKAKTGNKAIAPTTMEFNAVLHSFAIAGRGAKAQDLLARMMHGHVQNQFQNARPNLESYKCALLAWKNSKEADAPDRVEAILDQMQELKEAGAVVGIYPTGDCLNIALHCLAKQGRNVNPRRLESLLRKYEAVSNTTSWSIVIDFCAALGNARTAESLLRSMPDSELACANTITYTLVIKAWGNSIENDKCERAEALLREMYDRHENGRHVKPNVVTFTTLMHCYLNSDHPQAVQRVEALKEEVIERSRTGEEDLAYDNYMFHAVLQTHCRHGKAEEAEALLDQLCAVVLEGSNEQKWELSYVSLNSVLGSWLLRGNAGKAEAILRRMCHYRDDAGMRQIQPTPRNYIDVIECWNRSGDSVSGERADCILQMMEMDYPKVVAGKGLYLGVMKGLAQSGFGQQAEALLRRVQSNFQNEKCNTEMDLFLYREVCLAWKQSKHPAAAEQVKRLEGEMTERFSTSWNNLKK